MKLFGFSIERVKDLRPASPNPPNYGVNSEFVQGGWQRNLVPPMTDSVLAFSAVYACISLISSDIAKLRLKLARRKGAGTWEEVDRDSPYLPVLRKPNHFETRSQFVRSWIVQKLIHGNAYALKRRQDLRGIVTSIYMLDSTTTTPLVADNGDVFYRIGRDRLAAVREDDRIVPASEIIHDRMLAFWHPLIGVSPIFACGTSAAQGAAIQANAESFFENRSMPSGLLIFPQAISQDQAAAIKAKFDTGYSGSNIGKFAVVSGDVKWQPMTITATDAQLIEQLGWTVGDVARCFHVPPYKLGLQTNVTFSNAGQLNQDYYSQCLQTLIEDFEALLDEGLELGGDLRTEFDLDGLLRMDPGAQADIDQKDLGSGVLSPNEARARRNLPPVDGGDAPFMQQQMWQIGQLAERTPPSDVPPSAPEPPADDSAENDAEREEEAKQLAKQLAEDESRALIDRLNRSAAGA